MPAVEQVFQSAQGIVFAIGMAAPDPYGLKKEAHDGKYNRRAREICFVGHRMSQGNIPRGQKRKEQQDIQMAVVIGYDDEALEPVQVDPARDVHAAVKSHQRTEHRHMDEHTESCA
jgi:hypothetical protein